MTLALVELESTKGPLPEGIAALIDDAKTRIDEFIEVRADQPIVAYVPSDFLQVGRSIGEVVSLMLAPGQRFLEWGSGVGVVTCLAAALGFDAVGIEIEFDLVELSRELAADHGMEVQFVHGNFLPAGAEDFVDQPSEVAWLRTDGRSAYDDLDLEPDDFDVIFAYPWPGEEQIVFELFDHYAATGALLMTFHGQEGVQLHRKVSH